MDSDNWLIQLRDIARCKDWDSLYSFRTQTNELFTRKQDAAGLRDFYKAVARIALSDADAAPFLADDSLTFRKAVASALLSVKHKLKTRPELRGVYFEYYCDGHDDESNAGNFFLCTQYSEEDDEWACVSDRTNNVIDGPRLPPFMFYDKDWEWQEDDRLAADEIANGLILAAVLDEWKRCGIAGIPLAMANHDHQIVRVDAL